MNAGFILLYRQITEWEWYQNPNTFRVFLHCLLMANFTDGRFEGRDIKRGQFVTSLPNLAKQTKLSIQQVRTALYHLKSTGEITDTSTSKYRLITVVKYNDYQQDNRQNNSQSTGEQQASNRQVTGNQQQYNNNNNNNNGKREKGNNDLLPEPLITDDDAKQIQKDHDRVLNAAEDAGFKMTNDVRANLINLYAEHGLQKMLDGFKACSEHGALNLAYLRAVLKGGAKVTKGKVLPIQDFGQRDYSSVDDELKAKLAAEMAEFKAQGGT